MKIIHVLNAYLPNHIAGTEVYVAALVRELKNKNVTSKVIIPNYGKTTNQTYLFEGIEIIQYAEPSIANRAIITGVKPPNGIKNFIDILNIQQPDVVHFHELAGSIGVGLFHVKATKAAGFKSIMTFHLAKYTCKTGTLMYMNEKKCDGVIRALPCSQCWLADSGERGLRFEVVRAGFTLIHYLNIDTRFLKNSIGTALAFPKIISEVRKNLLQIQTNTNAIIILTNWYKNILIKNGVLASHISLIEQGLPINSIEICKEKSKNKKLRLVFIGRISPFKGVDLLLSALKQISAEMVELDIYGASIDENYRSNCLKISEGMENVKWKGSIAHTSVIRTINNYDLLCIPSAVSEMGPFVLKEAFAAGVPVLASNVYGNAEQIIDGENGWLFKFKNVEDLKIKIEYLINNPAAIENAKTKIPAIKSFEKVADEHILLYENVISQ